ncbi:MAG: hypothetical protein ACJ796_17215 [Gemmatimonadaceae bacterium]
MTRPLSPAFLIPAALALVDEASAPHEAPHELPPSDAAASVAADPVPSVPADPVPSVPADPVPSVPADPATSVAVNLMAGWSATFVHRAGYWSHYDYRLEASRWPLPATSSCEELAAFAADNVVLADDEPNPGDIYLLWSPAKKLFVRTGIILGLTQQHIYPSGRIGYECLTVDGDTTVHGSLRGPSTAIIRRILSADAGDRWIRWALLDRGIWEQPSLAESTLRRAA